MPFIIWCVWMCCHLKHPRPNQTRLDANDAFDNRLKVDWHTTCYTPCYFIVCEKFMLCSCSLARGAHHRGSAFLCYHGIALTSARKCFAPLVLKLACDTKTIPLKLMGFLVCFNHLLSSKNREHGWVLFSAYFLLAFLCARNSTVFTRTLFTFAFDHRMNVCIKIFISYSSSIDSARMFNI